MFKPSSGVCTVKRIKNKVATYKGCDRKPQWQLKSLKWSSDLYNFSSAVFLYVISDTIPCETSMPHLDAVRSDRGGNWEMIMQPLKLIWKPAVALIQRRHLKVTGSGCDVQVSPELYCGPLFFSGGFLNMDIPVVIGEKEKWNEVMGELLKCCKEKCLLGETETLLNATVAMWGCLYHAVHWIAVTVLWKVLQTAIKETFTPFYINLHKLLCLYLWVVGHN